MSHGSPESFLVDGLRTRQGRYGGALSGVRRGPATLRVGRGVAMLGEAV